jgi:hypothetical protein
MAIRAITLPELLTRLLEHVKITDELRKFCPAPYRIRMLRARTVI